MIFSGIQPTGVIHLGNLFGAVWQWKELLEDPKNDCIFCVVDLHAITLPQKPDDLRHSSRRMIASLMASGIDYEKCLLFKQSDILEHTQLSWILSCVSTLPQLQRLPQFQDKVSQLTKKQSVPFGLLSYPVLQAADILLYKAEEVPVGEDQSQQIHLAQDLAEKFNQVFGDTFPIPRPKFDEHALRIKSLRDPSKKMSKSDKDPKSRIVLTDTPDAIREKCKKAVTDFTSQISFDPVNRPGVSNLLTIHSLVTTKSPEDICNEFSTLDTAQYKLVLADVLIEFLKPIQGNMNELLKDESYLNSVLVKGKERGEERAKKTLIEVKNKVGLS